MIDGLVQQLGYQQKLAFAGSYRRDIAEQAERAASLAEPELALLRARSDKVDGFVDVGAADGLYLAYLQPTGLHCVGFEPNPASARLLSRAFPEVEIHQVAVGAETHEGLLKIPRTSAGRQVRTLGSLRETAPAGMAATHTTVPIRPLDSFDLPMGRLMLKIDVEGAELEVLAGASETLERVDVALVECEERHAPGAPSRLIKLMVDCGFDGWVVFAGELIPTSDFRVEVHQSPDLVAALGVNPDAKSMRAYGNNFLFVRQGQV